MAKRKITVDEIKDAAEYVEKESVVLERSDYLSTGSTMLNLALTNKWNCGFLPSHYYHLVGSSSSGKTFLSGTCFAESTLNEKYKNYKLIYCNSEDGCLMDMSALFGAKTAARIKAPAYDEDGNPMFATTVESFYYSLSDAMSDGTPCVFVLDSIDALTSDADDSKFEEAKDAFKKGKEAKGSYGMVRAKQNSEKLRKVMADLTRTGSILIIISQTRDNVGAMGYGPQSTFAGGKSLLFYATCQIWSKPIGNIKKTVDGNDLIIGKKIELAVKKNRITGYEHTVNTSIYPSYGIADLPSVIDYLLESNHWKKEGRSVVAPEFDFKGLEDTLIAKLESENREDELRMIAETVWNSLLDRATPKWKKRYE